MTEAEQSMNSLHPRLLGDGYGHDDAVGFACKEKQAMNVCTT